ncbi:hypothetical protein [Nocardioides gilvus]|uniref:hypothetical protein n=1 Tax=Nocardioides gilvus TaxID=1735589 RepID=UPI000D748806|nr:hypothetical protein [Nocardioides gilvus]
MFELLPSASPSRRAVVGAAAWSVPAVVLTSAAPAFANSPGATTTPQFSFGPTPVVPSPDIPLVWDLNFVGAQITAPSTLTGPSVVTMTITFQPNATSQYPNQTVYTFPAPAGWSSNRPADNEFSNVILTSLATIAAGDSLTVNGLFAGTAADNQFGTFTVVVGVGATSSSFAIATPTAFPPV